MNKIALPYSTKNFRLVPISETDREFHYRIHSNPQIMKFVGGTLSKKKANSAFDYLLKQLKSKEPLFLTWIVIEKTSNKKIGIQTLFWYLHEEVKQDPIFKTEGQPEIGILLDSTVQGREYAVEAMGSLVQYTFFLLKANYINLYYYNKHRNTINFINKLGSIFDREFQPQLPEWGYQYLLSQMWHFEFIDNLVELNEAYKLRTIDNFVYRKE